MSFVHAGEGYSNASSPGSSPQSHSPLAPPGVLSSGLPMRSPAAPHLVASSSTTAEMRLVDVVSALSRLEVQMTKDIDAVRHAQASATLRGILGESDITAREGRGGAVGSTKGSRAAAAEIDVPNTFSFADKAAKAAGDTDRDYYDDDGARSEFGIELESQGEMSSFRSSVAPPLGPFAGGGMSQQNGPDHQAAATYVVSAPPSTIPPRILALRAAQR